MDVHTAEQRSRNMKAIRNKNTLMEKRLAKALWAKGYRYRRNDNTVIGKPDIVFKTRRIAIFIDGEYFHGKDWSVNKYRIKTNREYWWKKIESNQMRDQLVNIELVENGWKVLRFWSNDVRKNLELCIQKIKKELGE